MNIKFEKILYLPVLHDAFVNFNRIFTSQLAFWCNCLVRKCKQNFFNDGIGSDKEEWIF